MKRLYKTITLSSLSALAVVAPVVTVVACGGSDSGTHQEWGQYAKSWEVGSRRDIKILQGTQSGTNPYGSVDWQFAPTSIHNAAQFGEALNSATVGPFRMDVEGFARYNSKGELIEGEAIPKEILRFEAAKSVTITKEDDTKVVFNSDSSDESDSSSINGNAFSSLLKSGNVKAVSIDFPEKANQAKWITQGTGTATASSTVGPEDVWYTIMHGVYSNDKTRDRALGSTNRQQADAWGTNVVNGGYSWSGPDAQTPDSPYMGALELIYGLECDPFKTDTQSDFVVGNSAVFNFGEEADGTQISNFWENMFRLGGGMKLVSADQIKQLSTSITVPGVDTSNPVNKYGVYQYNSLDWNQYLVAGQYYLSKNENKEVVYQRNMNYVDAEWLALPDTINSYTYTFADSGTAKQSAITGYKQGLYVSAPLDRNTTPDAYEAAIANPMLYGTAFTKGFTANGSIGDSSYTFLNANPWSTNPNFNYYFNDGYAKVMFGGTIADFTTPTPTPEQLQIREDAYSHFYLGEGLQFRTALNAAMNYVTAVSEYNPGYQEWTSRFAPEMVVHGTDGETQPIQEDKLSSRESFSVDDNGHISNGVEVTRDELLQQYANSNGNAQYLPGEADLSALKALVSDALDKSGVGPTEKVQFELPIGRGITNPTINPVYEQMRKAINSLDPRLQVVARLKPVSGANAASGGALLTVETTEYTPEFKLTKPDGQTSDHVSRLAVAGQGSGAFSNAPTSNPYEIQSPAAAMLQNIGYLQDGPLLAISAAAAQVNPYAGTSLESLNVIAESMQTTLTTIQAEWLAKGAAGLGLTSEVSDELFTGLTTMNIETIIHSSMTDVSEWDYGAFPEFEAFRTAMSGTLSDEESAMSDYSLMEGLVNVWFQKSMYDLRDLLLTKTVAEQVAIMNAWDEVSPFNINVDEVSIGNRYAPAPSLRKAWFNINSDLNKNQYIGTWRINLDL